MESKKLPSKKRSVLAKIGRGIAIFFLSLIGLVLLILVLIQTAPVQNFARKKIVGFLENKLNTRVEIQRLDIDFPKMLVLEGVYIEDRQKDTLVAGKQLKVDIEMMKLLKSEISIREINLNGITAKIKRQLPDTTFNFQFIMDAFATAPKTETVEDTSAALKMNIDKIIVDKTRFVYLDVVTGNDVDVYLNHFNTDIDTFDPDHLRFDVPNITLNGVHGKVNQTKPLAITTVVTDPDSTKGNAPPAFLNFTNKKVEISDIDISYSNAVAALTTRFAFESLNVYPESIDMKNSVVSLKEVELNKLNGSVSMGSKAESDLVKLTNDKNEEIPAEALPWRFTVKKIRFNNNSFVFDDNTKKGAPRGIDFAHMNIKDLTLHADNFLFGNDTIQANLIKGNMTEKSGFILNNLTTDFTYSSKGATLQNLLIKTPGTEIKRSAVIRYPSLEAFQKNIALLELDINLDNSKIQVKDILTFVPALAAQPAFRNPNSSIFINSRVRGSIARLKIDYLQFRGLQNTNIDMSGNIANATDPNNVFADVNIKTFKTSKGDILSLVPPNTIPNTITLPESIAMNGIVRGGMKQAFANVNINTSLGSAKINGTISNPTNPVTAKYNADISTSYLNLGAITKQPQNVGAITANFTIVGTGFDPEKANAKVSGLIRSAQVKNYTYRNLKLNASINRQRFTANAGMQDPNLHFAMQAEGDISGELPGFTVNAQIDSIKTLPLHLTPEAIVYHGNIQASFPQLNLDALNGDIFITNSVLVMNNQRIQMDTLSVNASTANNEQTINLKSDFLTAQLQGQYKLEQLGTIMMNAIQPYYAISAPTKPVFVDPYNFTINAVVVDHPTLKAFMPDLQRMDGIALKANFTSSDGWTADVKAPYILYGTNKISDLNLSAVARDSALDIVTNVAEISSGPTMALYGTNVTATLANNKINFGLRLRDKANKDKYKLSGLFAQEPNDVFMFSLKPDSLMLNYDLWNISSNNIIRVGKDIVNASNFILSKNNQQLSIASTATGANSPLDVNFSNFKISTLSAFVQSDSLVVDGTINGGVHLQNVMTQPSFTTDLNVNNVAFKRDTIGDINIKVSNTNQNTFATNINITGRGNDVGLTGNYYLKPENKSNFDFDLNIRQLPFKTLETVSMGAINQSTGNLTGSVKINGTVASPKIDGGISFNKTGFNVVMLGSYFQMDNETIKINNEGIRFDTFTIKDSANNNLVIDGAANTTNFMNYRFDMTVKARNFRALNSTKKDNPLYYGQLFFNSNLVIKGSEVAPVVDGNLRVNEATKLTFVLPQSQPGLVDREGVIEFIDMDAPETDSIFKQTLALYDSSFNNSAITGFDITANIEIVKEADFNIVIDEGNGDFLNLKGAAVLNGGIDPSGKITLTGNYVVESGGYELSFNFIRRRFNMQKGSTITWTGEPTTANIDVTAVYVANTSAIDLLGDQLSEDQKGYYMQKLPFEVRLMMKGELMKPDLTFDIALPSTNNLRVSQDMVSTVNLRLDQLKNEPSELNKQVFALLLLNRFVGENPFASGAGGGGFNAAMYAKQSVSKILTEQLNKLAGDLIAGVDISFDVNSTEDYSTGSAQARTDFNVALSKRLLNDRLKVTVGSNFELEGPQQQAGANASSAIGNISVDYNLTKDGRYLIRAYSRNEYEGIIEGYVVETGLRFIMSVDYNKFQEIFKQRSRLRKARQEAREREKESKLSQPTTATDTPVTENTTIVQFEKVSADDRKSIPATDKVSTDEN